MTTIKLAPDLEEFKVSKNVISVEFNGMKIKYIMAVEEDIDHETFVGVSKCLQAAIALSSKSWQISRLMDDCVKIDDHPAGRCEFEEIK